MLIKTIFGSFPFVLDSFPLAKSKSSFGTLREVALFIGYFWVALLVESAFGSICARLFTTEIKFLYLILRPVILLTLVRWPYGETRIHFLVFGVESDLRNGWVSISFGFTRVMTLSSIDTLSRNKVPTLRGIEACRTCRSLERRPVLLDRIPDDVWFNSWKRSLLNSFKCGCNMRWLKFLLHRFWICSLLSLSACILEREIIRRRNGWQLNSWSPVERCLQVSC